MVPPRPHQGLVVGTPTKRSKKTFRSSTGPGTTRPRQGAASTPQRWCLELLGSAWSATSSFRDAAKLTKVSPSWPTNN
eukprot:1415701-Amphidinium_carterae.1